MDDKKTDRPVHLRKVGSGPRTGVTDAKIVDFVAPHGMFPSAAQTGAEISFGPYTLSMSERLLTREGAPVELGGRAFDLLAALASRPSEVISKNDLLARVWPDVTVEAGNLRFHIANLRKALGDGKDGARYITTEPGRGYAFVAPVSRSDKGNAAASAASPHANLPGRLIRMVGRADDILAVSSQLATARLVTIVGAGGVGKTTVAVAVAHELMESFGEAVLFVDLGAMREPNLVAASIASMVGLSVQSDDATPSLIAHLRERRLLLILDTCEHLVEAVAGLATRIFTAAPQVHILATSREALRVEDERVYNLATLGCPPNDAGLTVAALQAFPATQLFLERAAAAGVRLDLADSDAAIVAGICRKLDGLALAIELAAGRMASYGLQQTAALLDQRLSLQWRGRRIAPPRQKTLQATLDWSYGLLSELERMVLRRLAVFVGHFTIDAALAVVAGETADQAVVVDAIDSLVAKSMVAAQPFGAMMRYRLLDTTRSYTLEISVDEAERAEMAERHATYYKEWLAQLDPETLALPDDTERMSLLAALNNVRAALGWCFSVNRNAGIGVELALAAAPAFLAMSLLTECHHWSERAILALDDAARAGPQESHLQTALGHSLMFTLGQSEAARMALDRAFAIAEERRDPLNQLLLLAQMHLFHMRAGEFGAAMNDARRGSAIAKTINDTSAVTLSHFLLGTSLHLRGDLSDARVELEAALIGERSSPRISTTHLGFDHQNLAGAFLARTLWLEGHPARALERAHQTVDAAERLNHPLTLAIALHWAVSTFLWARDLPSAEKYIDWFLSHAESYSLRPYHAVGWGLKGELMIRQGDTNVGVGTLERCLATLNSTRYELLTTTLSIALAEGLAATNRFADAISLVDKTIHTVSLNGDRCYIPELLRVRGKFLLSMPERSGEEAERCFMQSLEESRRQGARGWGLRTAIDLAAYWVARDEPERSRSILEPVYAQFTEELDIGDMKEASRLLETLR